MFRKASGSIRKLKVDNGFDDEHPVARGIRSLVPPAGEMRLEAQEELKARILVKREQAALGVAGFGGETAATGKRRRFGAFAAAAAALCIIAAVAVPMALRLSRGSDPVPAVKHFAFIQIRKGAVEVRQAGGAWHKARAGEKLAPGTSVRTGGRSYASVDFPDGSAMRVTDESEVRISTVGASSASIEHVSGGSYHRVSDGSDYTVENSDVQTRSAGAVFNVENRVPGSLEIVTLDRAVKVEIGEHKPIPVNRGEVMVVDTTAEMKADKQPVSRERLEEERLYASASEDAMAGYPTGIYEQLDVPLDTPPEREAPPPAGALSIELKGTGTETGTSLSWGVSGDGGFDTLVLLRSVVSEPVFPDGEIARYVDTSITSATDNSVLQEETYQYRIAAVESGELVTYSNTLVVTIPKAAPRPATASVSLQAQPGDGSVLLEWSVADATGFTGYALERVVTSAPSGSKSPAGSQKTVRIDSSDVLYSYTDTAVEPGCVYSYRVGLVVDSSVMVYSESVTAEIPAR